MFTNSRDELFMLAFLWLSVPNLHDASILVYGTKVFPGTEA